MSQSKINHSPAPPAKAGSKPLVIDFSEVTSINSGEIAICLAALQGSHRAGREVVFGGVRENVREVFETVGLHKVFTISATAAGGADYNLAQLKELALPV